MTGLPSALALALLGNAAIYAGLAFVNGWIWPALPLATGGIGRLTIMMVALSLPANALFALVYRQVDAGAAGMAILATLVLVMVAKALLHGDAAITARGVAAVGAVLVSAVWAGWELRHG